MTIKQLVGARALLEAIEYKNRHLSLRLILFPISLAMTISSVMIAQQSYSYGEFGLIAFMPAAFWIGFFLMLTCTILSLRQAKTRASETLIMVMAISGTLSLILPLMSTLPIRSDSYGWMHLVETTLSSGATDNPNQYMRWPIFWIFGAEFADISSVGILDLFRLAPTLFSVLAPIYFYLISRELLRDVKASLYATLLFALTTSQRHLCPALLGWFLLLLSLYLLIKSTNTKCVNFASLFIVLALTLTMEHHLSSFIFVFLAANFVVGKFLSERTKIFGPSPMYSATLVMFLFIGWILWMASADMNFLAKPFESLISLGSITWSSNPVALTGLSGVRIGSALVFRGIIYLAGLSGFILLIKEKRRIIEIAGWFFSMFTVVLISQLILGGQYPFEPLRFEFFAVFPLLMFGGYFVYYIHRKHRSIRRFLIIGIILSSLVLSNQIYRGTNTYIQQFFLQDKSVSTWISHNTVQPVVLITDYRLNSFLSYMNNSYVCNSLIRNDVVELFTDQNVSLIMSNVNKAHANARAEYNSDILYLVVDRIQLLLGETNQPYSNEAIDRFNKISFLNEIYDNGKLVAYSNEEGK